MFEQFTDINKAKAYLKEIKADAFLVFENLDDETLLELANVNWSQGLRKIKEVEFPDD